MSEGKIICAVDFGTTYSGVGYAFWEQGVDPKEVDIEIVEDHWPGQGSQSSPKVPTVFKFDKKAPDGFKWGFQLDDDPERICFAKLYLDPSQIQAAQALATFSSKLGRLPPNRKVTDGIARYLAALRAVALDRMAADWTQDFVDETPIEYILTVPAVWSDKAKSDTLWCASQAGFGDMDNIRLITEPEAAAVYTFTTLPDFSVKPGDVFITCDAGGGTVDLTTYKVASNNPVLRVDEVTVGGGGLCGSVYLNKRFEELIRKKIGKELDGLSKTASLEAMDEINRIFNEEIKPDFGTSGDEDKEYTVLVPTSFPDDEATGVKGGKLIIPSSELKGVFDKVMQAIFQLIVEQLERVEEADANLTVSAILLVGGFGSSEYLRQATEEHFGEDIKVIQPPDAWSAVTRGAMLRGLQGDIVKTRIIRAYYGIVYKDPWNPAVHETGKFERMAAKNKLWDNQELSYFCSNLMNWYVKKGDEFTDKKVVRFGFYRALADLSNLVFPVSLYIFNGAGEAPLFLSDDCKALATIQPDLSSIPKDEIPVVRTPTGSWYKLSYEVEMSFETSIAFKLLYDGKVISELAIDYGKR